MTHWAPNVPIMAPKPLVININTPCALERIDASVSLSTYREPDTLKKSNATPYTIIETMSNAIPTPVEGLPRPNSPKRNTHAPMLISITFLIPKRFKAKGISKIHKVSDTWESEISALALLAPQEPEKPSNMLKPLINGLA